MADYVQLDAVTPHWRNFFEDGLVLDLFEEKDLMRKELEKLPGDSEQHWKELQEFLDYARQQYDVIDKGYLKEGLDGLWEFLLPLWHWKNRQARSTTVPQCRKRFSNG